jgi:hypothetical protein
MSSAPNNANSTNNQSLVTWNVATRQYVPGAWPWVPGQSYFLLVTNVTANPQNFALTMDGRNDLTDDNDMDGLPDAWEYYYFGNLNQNSQGDPDKDGVMNQPEYLAGTDPTDPTSYPPSLTIMATNGTVVQLVNPPRFYVLGSTIQLIPVPNPGYAFEGWAGDAYGNGNPFALTFDTNKTVIAIFKLAGDDLATALPISGSTATGHGSNVSFTKETGEPWHAGNPGGKSSWWIWTAPASGPISIDTGGTPFITLLAVYTGNSVSNLTPIASNKDLTGGTNQVVFNAISNTTYDIAVDGYNGAFGRIILNLNSAATAAPDQPPQLSPEVLPTGAMQLTVSATPGRTYLIEVSEDLVNWRPLSSVATQSTGTSLISDTNTSGVPSRFYRARLQ